jgi:DNA helicase-2/ATP-dependent DNA helicase PcrA
MAGDNRGLSAMSKLVPSPEQQNVLDLGLCSIRIRAGAGTGKTTTVAMVIANLVEEHGLEPEQILGITFTNKAAAELADRVRRFLPDTIDPGRHPEVHTYHGFAAQILAEFGALAGVDNRSRVITPTFARQIMGDTFRRTAFARLDITQDRTLDRIRKLGDRLGDHLKQSQDLLDVVPSSPDEVWEARIEMAETLARYEGEKNRLKVVDYGDLVTLSTRIVTQYPDLAAAIRDRYAAIVLDEYQDTNPAQRVLLTTIFDNSFPVIAVGDEDQTIYEWRGASAENFDLFPTHFGPGVVDRELTLNRRSAQEILQIANEARRAANPSAKDLEAANSDVIGEVVTYWATDAAAEADWIARRFEELHDSGLPWSDMAVLLRKNKDFALIVDAMSRHDIPIEVANVGGLFSVPEVADLRAWLELIERPEDSTALVQILFGSRFRLGLADVAALTTWVARTAKDEDSEEPTPVTLIEAVERTESIAELRPAARQALLRFLTIYRSVLTESQGQSLVETCRTVLDRTRSWQDIEALPPNARLTARLNIYRLLDLAQDWSPLKGRPSLQAFLDYLAAMEDEPAEELDSAHLSGEEAVTLVTVHRAKGLEWDTVAVPAVTQGNFPSGVGQFPDPARFAEFLPVDLRIDATLGDMPEDRKQRDDYLRNRHNAQEWRVAYVALSRAKRRLFVTGAYWYGQPEPLKTVKKPSPLFELVASNPVSVDAGFADQGPPPTLLRVPPRGSNPDPLFGAGWETGIRSLLGNPRGAVDIAHGLGITEEYEQMLENTTQRLFNLATPIDEETQTGPDLVSVTGLVTYAQCHKRYYWSNVDPLPRRPNPAAIRGTEVHRRIELHQRGKVPFEEFSEALYDSIDGDEWSGPSAYDNYSSSRFAEQTATLVESPFSVELSGGHTVRGRVDAIYTDGERWEIVDFKSGRAKEDPSRIVQLEAYAVAARDVDFGLPKPTKLAVTFAYLGGGLEEVSYDADEAWVDNAAAHLNGLLEAIASKDFDETPGDWCKTCDFLSFCAPGQRSVSG